MKKNILTTVVILLIALSITNAQEKYALIIAGEYDPDNISFPSTEQWNNGNLSGSEVFDEFWNDAYLMWEMLVYKKDYVDDNVHVLFANNIDYTFENQDIRYKAALHNLPKVTDDFGTYSSINGKFSELAATITENDFLFVWVMGHGGTDASGSYFYSYDAQKIYDTQLAIWLDGINAYKKTVFLSTPSSGGFTDELEGERTVVITSSGEGEGASRADDQSNSGTFIENEDINGTTYNHGEANYHLYSSLAGETPDFQTSYAGTLLSEADVNNDEFISIGESQSWLDNKESTVEDPVISDLSIIRNYTDLSLPTILHGTIENDMLCRGLCGITLEEPHIMDGTTFTFDGIVKFKEILNTYLHFNIGSTTVINDETEFSIYEDKPWIKGFLNFGDDVIIKTKSRFILQQQNIENIYHLSFWKNTISEIIVSLELYNTPLLTIESSFFYEGSRIIGRPVDLFLDSCLFISSVVNLSDPIDMYNQVLIDSCIFTGAYDLFDDFSSILLNGYEGFQIINSGISWCHRDGISLEYCGLGTNEVPRIIENDTIMSNSNLHSTAIGIRVHASNCDIRNNKIIRNDLGIVTLSDSKVLLQGNINAVFVSETQEIRGHPKYEVFSVDEFSFPYHFKWNYVEVDDDEFPDVVIQVEKCKKTHDITLNYWSEFFDSIHPEIHFSPIECFDWDPEWYLTTSSAIPDETEILYETAQLQIDQGNYSNAQTTLIQLINTYPSSHYAETGLKDLIIIENSLGQNYQSLYSYLLNDTTILNNENLEKLGKSLANKCLILEGEYTDALNNYYDILNDSISYHDSLITLINIEYVNYLIENNVGLKSGGNQTINMKTYTDDFHYENINYYNRLLLNMPNESLLSKLKKLKNGELLQNFPNPFTASTNIYYKLLEPGIVEIKIYNYIGQLVISSDLGYKNKGSYNYILENPGLSEGLYIYNLELNGVLTDSKKMTFCKN